jgi:hypothetical protein
MDFKKAHKISQWLMSGPFSIDEAYNAMEYYINLGNYPDEPADNAQTSIKARKDEMLKLAIQAGVIFKDSKFEKIKALLTGGNRHTKRTKRTTNRKMRKSLIRRRRR